MSSKYYVIFTNIGMAKLANATALGSQLKITHMAVGDGAGIVPDPKENQTKLVNECYRAKLNSLSVDKANANQIIAELVLPETVGGWYVRETGLYDEDGDLIAVANAPESYKPQLQEGAGRSQVVKMVLIVSNTDAVTLKIDPAVVLATRQYVDEVGNKKLSKSENLGDLTDVTKAVDNLGLGAGAPPIGIPFYWPSQVMPNLVMDEWAEMVFLKWNNATFSKVEFPKLALVIPSLTLNEVRGTFVRVWDDGRGVDVGRDLLSEQLSANQAHTHQVQVAANPATDALRHSLGYGITGGDKLAVKANSETTMYGNPTLTYSTGGSESRPRNVAFNFLVRAK